MSKKTQQYTVTDTDAGIIEHHSHNYPGPFQYVISGFVVLIGLGLLIWWVIIKLMEIAGIKNPTESLAEILLYFILACFILAPAIFIINHLISTNLESKREHEREMKKLDINLYKYQQTLAAGVAADSRTFDKQTDLITLCYLIAADAFNQVSQYPDGRFPGRGRPWSNAQAGAHILPGKEVQVGERQAAKARNKLTQLGFISGDQINWNEFPDLRHVESILFAAPVRTLPLKDKN